MKDLLIHSHEKSLHKNRSRISTQVPYMDNPDQKLDVLLNVAGNVLLVQGYLMEFEKMIQLSKDAKRIKRQYIKIMNYINAELHEDYREYYSERAQTLYAEYMRSSKKRNFGGIHILHRYIPQRKSIY
ncbi:hypothetical protein F7984_07320 [Pradoshia sp. D12]|uniref:hypothetical protein n=1 Tax=Bacillaceae TaxID=186817 RepID=UPI00111EC8DF|nr:MULTISPECIES: hypothetical protein [Bacillaceae]QFK71070.1 hypothetical protein F7984_07320 [Pradoshia sp. D12]TPF72862.1 hypothetical protein FHY44_03705 [Bacillus sp. D12]